MGFNFSGIVINKSYENKIEELATVLKAEIRIIEEQDFELATESWKEPVECDIYFTSLR